MLIPCEQHNFIDFFINLGTVICSGVKSFFMPADTFSNLSTSFPALQTLAENQHTSYFTSSNSENGVKYYKYDVANFDDTDTSIGWDWGIIALHDSRILLAGYFIVTLVVSFVGFASLLKQVCEYIRTQPESYSVM